MEKTTKSKIAIWFWSFVSGMGLISAILSYKQGFQAMALTQFALVLVTTLVSLKYLEEVSLLSSHD